MLISAEELPVSLSNALYGQKYVDKAVCDGAPPAGGAVTELRHVKHES